MFVAFDVVQRKDRAVPWRQLGNCFIQSDAVDYRHRVWVLCPLNDLHGSFAILRGCLHANAPFPEVHEHLVNGQAMEPGRKGRFSAKASNFSKELDENLLCEVFSFRDISSHPQAEGINAAIMALIDLLEGFHVALSGPLSQSVIGLLLCLGLGCAHVFVCRESDEDVCSRRQSRVRGFKGAAPVSLNSGQAGREQGIPYPQLGCDAALRARRCLIRP